jgi:hypothetical protein
MCDNSKHCFYPCSKHSSPWRDNRDIFIHYDHECKTTAMTPKELLKHLKNEVDSAHKAISIYLETLNSFSQGHVRQDLGVNSKKKPDSDKEEKEEEEREEEEEEVAAALDSDCSCELIVKKPFLALIVKAKASILILPKFRPKRWFFGLLMILN